MPARNRIHLVTKTLGVLETLAECGGTANLKEISTRIGLVKSSVFRILFSLKELGYVEQRGLNGAYSLTWKMHSLIRKGAARLTILDLARPHMSKLRDDLQETVWLAEWRKRAGVVIGSMDVPHRLRFSIDLGSTVGLHSTALGKAIAAYLPAPILRDAMGNGKLVRLTAKTITTREGLRVELQTVRQQGFALNREESVEGLFAVAAPIFDSHKRVMASLSVGSPIFRCPRARQKTVIEATRQTAEAITRDLINVDYAGSDSAWTPAGLSA